jgi:hypothetical protein
MTKCVHRARFRDCGFLQRCRKCALYQPLIHVMTPHHATPRIDADPLRRTHVLPCPLFRRSRVLPLQGVREIYSAQPPGQIGVMAPAYLHEMRGKRAGERPRQHRMPVLLTLPIPDQNRVLRKVQIFHAQTQGLDHSKAGSVQELADNPLHALQILENRDDLLPREDHRQPSRSRRLYQIRDPSHVLP